MSATETQPQLLNSKIRNPYAVTIKANNDHKNVLCSVSDLVAVNVATATATTATTATATTATTATTEKTTTAEGDEKISASTTITNINITTGSTITGSSSNGVAYWERLPSNSLSFGSAEILTVGQPQATKFKSTDLDSWMPS